MILFFKIFFTEFIAEMGDKTQLMLIALTSKHKLKDIILGTAAAILVLNGLAVLAGGLVSELHFSILPHQQLPEMRMMKRKRVVNQRLSLPLLQFSVHFSWQNLETRHS